MTAAKPGRPRKKSSQRFTPGRPAPPVRSSVALLLPALCLAALLAYQPAWHGGMLWDDDAHITQAELRGTDGLQRIWLEIGATQQYYPVVHSAFWALHRVFGGDTLGYHLVNILLHALSAFLLAVILRRLDVPGATLAAFVFALHPVHVESVAWITELKNTLSGVLYLGAALVYLRFDRRRGRVAYGLALALFVLALLAKTVTATLPIALAIVVWWQRGRLEWRRDLAPLLPFTLLGVAGGLVTAWVERALIGAQGVEFQMSAIERGLLAGRAFWFYLVKLVWPVNLIFIYPRWEVSQAVWWQYLYPLATLTLFALLWHWRGRSRAPFAAALYFVVTLAPALGFVNVFPFRYSFVADHFQYLASIGIITLGAAVLVTVAVRRGWSRTLTVAGLAVVTLLGVLTWRQSRQYVDGDTLYRETLVRNPDCWMAYNNLGTLLLDRHGPGSDALALIDRSLALYPQNADAHNNRGVALERMGRYDEARQAFEEALRLHPTYAAAYNNLGAALRRLGRPAEAIAAGERALQLKPTYADAHHNLGLVLQEVGRVDEAIAHTRESLRLNPSHAAAYDNLGTALQRAGRPEEAVVQYREALRLDPGNSHIHNNLATALERQGRTDEAAAEYREALRLQPASAKIRYNLGNAYHQQGRLEAAAAEYREALKGDATAPLAEVHNDLGVVLARLGRRSEAVAHFKEALRLDPQFVEARDNLARASR